MARRSLERWRGLCPEKPRATHVDLPATSLRMNPAPAASSIASRVAQLVTKASELCPACCRCSTRQRHCSRRSAGTLHVPRAYPYYGRNASCELEASADASNNTLNEVSSSAAVCTLQVAGIRSVPVFGAHLRDPNEAAHTPTLSHLATSRVPASRRGEQQKTTAHRQLAAVCTRWG